MPTYEYACTQCGRHLEVVQGFADDPLSKCETCGGRLRRVFHPVGVLFKGSGFYSTDSRTKKKVSSTDGDKGDKKADSKPASDSSSSSGSDKKTPSKDTSS